MNQKIRIGTRGSKLALYQAEVVSGSLKQMGFDTELVKITTSGDKFLSTPLTKIGGKGLFIKEIEEALLGERIDIAVHSLKDMPVGVMSDQLVFSAFLEREDSRDVYIPKIDTVSVLDGKKNLIIGTSSLRREVQLRIVNSDYIIEPLRGNINTRLEKLDNDHFDGIVLAYAGILRLAIKREGMVVLSKDAMVPSPGQGTIVIESRKKDPLNKDLEKLDHEETKICSLLERDLTGFVGGTCLIPFGANFEKNGENVTARVFLQWNDKTDYFKVKIEDSWENRAHLAEKIKQMMKAYIS